jgi:hypothetical protein
MAMDDTLAAGADRIRRMRDASRAVLEKQEREEEEARRRGEEARHRAAVEAWERDVEREAEAGGGLIAPRPTLLDDRCEPVVRLPSPRKIARPPRETEALLNGLIADCAALLRDVAFRSACLTPDANDRLRFLAAAQSLARTGAKVGETIVRLRGGGAPGVETHRHELVYTHVQSTPLPPPSGADSANQ